MWFLLARVQCKRFELASLRKNLIRHCCTFIIHIIWAHPFILYISSTSQPACKLQLHYAITFSENPEPNAIYLCSNFVHFLCISSLHFVSFILLKKFFNKFMITIAEKWERTREREKERNMGNVCVRERANNFPNARETQRIKVHKCDVFILCVHIQ